MSSAQLVAAGFGRNAIGRRARAGMLHRVFRGVYAVGHPGISLEGRWMAAVLACGRGAVLSHASAAALWGLLRPVPGPIDVSVPTYAGRGRREGLRVHRCEALARDVDPRLPATTVRDLIPVTSVPRTLSDLRRSVTPKLHRRATRQAQLAKFALAPGTRTDGTRSDLEGDFLALCRASKLPLPEVNVRLGRWTVDFLWRAERVAVETDSYRFHRGGVAFEDDHARDLDLRLRGVSVHRFTERQIAEEAGGVAADLRAALVAS